MAGLAARLALRTCPHAPRPSLPCTSQVHTGMAEQAFKQQVQSVMGDGNLTPDRAAALEKMREQVRRPCPGLVIVCTGVVGAVGRSAAWRACLRPVACMRAGVHAGPACPAGGSPAPGVCCASPADGPAQGECRQDHPRFHQPEGHRIHAGGCPWLLCMLRLPCMPCLLCMPRLPCVPCLLCMPRPAQPLLCMPRPAQPWSQLPAPGCP